MNVQEVQRSEVSRTLKIEVAADAVVQEYERVYARMSRSAELPGFRKGRVPRPILEPRLRSSVHQGVLESLLPQATEAAVTGQALKAVGRPAIEDIRYDGTGPLSFKAVVEVKPEFALGSVEGIEIRVPSAAVSDAEVDAQIEALRQRAAKPGDPKTGPSQKGDWVKIDFQGFMDDQPFPGGKGEGTVLVLGRGQMIPGFEEQLEGASAGETRRLKVEFPKDYPSRDLAGRPAEFLVSVAEVRPLPLPAVDDALAALVGGPEVADLAQLRARMRDLIGAQKARQRSERLMEAAAEELVARHAFTVPPSLVESEVDFMERGETGRLSAQGMELNGEEGRAAMRKALAVPAEKRARLALVLEKLAEAQSIAVADADLEAEAARLAPSLGVTAPQAAEFIRRSGREAGVRAQIRERKALEWVVAKAKVIDLA